MVRRLVPLDELAPVTVHRETRRGSRDVMVLRAGSIRRTVAHYDKRSRALVKVLGANHFLTHRPGLAWNLELIARADRWASRPRHLVAKSRVERIDGGERGPYVVRFEVAARFAIAAAEGDERYLIDHDVDPQVLIPWPAWRGDWIAPPAPTPPADPTPEPLSLFSHG